MPWLTRITSKRELMIILLSYTPMYPTHKDFWFLPLGGCGEIGMNLNLYAHAGSWLMVDCGVTFEKTTNNSATGNRIEMADPRFIVNRAESLVGLIATHAHEDHIGAIAHLWDQLRCPIYTTEFTRNVLLRKFSEKRVEAPIITVSEGQELELAPFRVHWLPITHSTPETNALLISTKVGSAFHTADWKLDSAPIVGDAIQPTQFQALADHGIDAMICDSTNATKNGRSWSESELFENLLRIVQQSPGRVVVSCFASNIARMQTLGNVAQVAGRYLGLLGRSMHNMVDCARAAGYLTENFNVVNIDDFGYLPPQEMLVIATGSQGEETAALSQLASDTHPKINLSAGDSVVFSAMAIPGNEQKVDGLIRSFEARNIKVTHADESPVPLHASGHPCAEELADLYSWVQPRLSIPVHGEDRHMQTNAAIARDCGVPHQLVGKNGDLFDLLQIRRRADAAVTGRLWLDEEDNTLRPC